ncbi:MAG: hypothetical protein FWD49_05700 [Firmicutes bacterium]|nr:hypothetical protein [Bacillota bacterium]
MKTTKMSKIKKIIGATLVLCLALGAGAFLFKTLDTIGTPDTPLRFFSSLFDIEDIVIIEEEVPLRFSIIDEDIPLMQAMRSFLSNSDTEWEFDEDVPLVRAMRFSMILDDPDVPLVKAMRFSASFDPDILEEIIFDEDVPLRSKVMMAF